MSHTHPDPEARLDRALAALADETMPERELEQAAARVRDRLEREAARVPEPRDRVQQGATLAGCDDFQQLIPVYLAGELTPARALLLDDHARGCIPCRRALSGARSRALGEAPAAPARASRRLPPALGWAAMLATTLALGWLLWALLGVVPLHWGAQPVVAELEGQLFELTADGYLPLESGQRIAYGTPLRSGEGAAAVVRLADGSEVELAPRSEIEVERRRRGTTVRLSRGHVIVEAAPQGAGHLFVATDDCLVSVTGTIFAVNHGAKGSRVSVVEGEVEVGYGSRHATLGAGQQVTTSASLRPVPVRDEVAWSRHVDDYLALLAELGDLQRELRAQLPDRPLRYGSALLDRVPADTVVYAGLPNVGGELEQAYRIIEERVAASPALARWWSERFGAGRDEVADGLERLAALGAQLGDEVVVAVLDGDEPRMLLLAEALDPIALAALLEAEIAAAGAGSPLVLVDDRTAPPPASDRLLAWIGDGALAIASDAALLAEAGAGGFAGSRLHRRLSEVYAEGADFLVAADLATLFAVVEEEDRAVMDLAGAADADILVLERRRDADDHVRHRAVLSFDGPRRGVASWLAAPAPMAALDFVSPEAHMVSAALIKDPELIIDDLARILGASGVDLFAELARLESEHGIDVVADLAEPLGGEMAFALDGPLLPKPGWKLMLEVYDPARLQVSIERAVAELRGSAPELADLRLDSERAGGRTYYRLAGASTLVVYAYVDGYLIAAPERALIEHAVRYRDSGYTLVSSPRFSSLLPTDRHANVSALAYQNLRSALGPLAELWQNRVELSAEQRRTLEQVVGDTPATLACAYGEEDRIVLVSDSEGDTFAWLLGVGGALGLDMFPGARL